MNFQDKDKLFQKNIVDALCKRHTINLNKDIGVAYLQPEFEDRINPQVTISANEIKKHTGRDKLRRIIIDEYVNAFNKFSGINAQRIDEGSIRISIEPVRSRDNEFGSISELNKQNSKELSEGPELSEDPYG